MAAYSNSTSLHHSQTDLKHCPRFLRMQARCDDIPRGHHTGGEERRRQNFECLHPVKSSRGSSPARRYGNIEISKYPIGATAWRIVHASCRVMSSVNLLSVSATTSSAFRETARRLNLHLLLHTSPQWGALSNDVQTSDTDCSAERFGNRKSLRVRAWPTAVHVMDGCEATSQGSDDYMHIYIYIYIYIHIHTCLYYCTVACSTVARTHG